MLGHPFFNKFHAVLTFHTDPNQREFIVRKPSDGGHPLVAKILFDLYETETGKAVRAAMLEDSPSKAGECKLRASDATILRKPKHGENSGAKKKPPGPTTGQQKVIDELAQQMVRFLKVRTRSTIEAREKKEKQGYRPGTWVSLAAGTTRATREPILKRVDTEKHRQTEKRTPMDNDIQNVGKSLQHRSSEGSAQNEAKQTKTKQHPKCDRLLRRERGETQPGKSKKTSVEQMTLKEMVEEMNECEKQGYGRKKERARGKHQSCKSRVGRLVTQHSCL